MNSYAPTLSVLFRKIMGAFAQFEKSLIAVQLKGSRLQKATWAATEGDVGGYAGGGHRSDGVSGRPGAGGTKGVPGRLPGSPAE